MTTPGATSTGPTAGSAPKDVTTINPLSNPKGVRLVCELCGKVAYIQCPFCRVTYYWYMFILKHSNSILVRKNIKVPIGMEFT